MWIFLALMRLVGGAAFFSLRALGRTPAKICSEKLARVERIDLARSVVATGKIAGLLPAIKAARLDPIEALRYE